MEPWSGKVAVLIDVEYLDVHNLMLLQTPLWKADGENVKEVSILKLKGKLGKKKLSAQSFYPTLTKRSFNRHF